MYIIQPVQGFNFPVRTVSERGWKTLLHEALMGYDNTRIFLGTVKPLTFVWKIFLFPYHSYCNQQHNPKYKNNSFP